MRKTSLRLTFDEFDDTLEAYAGLVAKIASAQQRFRQPGDFLWANTRPGGQMRFGVYLDALQKAASEMRNSLGPLAR